MKWAPNFYISILYLLKPHSNNPFRRTDNTLVQEILRNEKWAPISNILKSGLQILKKLVFLFFEVGSSIYSLRRKKRNLENLICLLNKFSTIHGKLFLLVVTQISGQIFIHF